MAESRLITISQTEISPNPVQVNKSYVIRVTIANRAYGLDYPYNYPYDYTQKKKRRSKYECKNSTGGR